MLLWECGSGSDLGNGEGKNLYQEFLNGINLAEENPAAVCVLGGLVCLAVFLAACLSGIQNHTVRIYNWNGKRYCYLGRAGMWREGDGYCVCIGERIADLSYTTLYQICPSKSFVRRNRYRNMALRAGDTQCMMHVDGCMRQSIYYREQQAR